MSKPELRDERFARPVGIDAQPEGPEDLWTPPPDEECDEPSPSFAQMDARNRITMRRKYWNKQLVDWAIIWTTTDDDGESYERVCIDCRHMFVHRHDGPHRRDTAVVIRPIISQSDVQDSFDPAFDEVYDAYEEFIDREEKE